MDEKSDSDDLNCTPPDIVEAANIASLNLLPCKSRKLYEKAYKDFLKWRKIKAVKHISENVLMAYFDEKSKMYKSPTLWSHYSMVKAILNLNENVDISRFSRLIALLKRKSEGYIPKKSKILNREQIEEFISNASDDKFLIEKVVLIFGIAGACRREELANLKIDDIQNIDSSLLVTIQETKTKTPRMFTIVHGGDSKLNFLEIVNKYIALRPENMNHQRFFVFYKNGKCSTQVVTALTHISFDFGK